jgi:hypothetical protein
MKFTKSFVDTLKVFSGLNQNMFFREGNIQTSVIASKAGALSFFIRAKTDVEIEKSFGIGSLGKFINALSLFSDPEITLTDNGALMIAQEGQQVTFRLTNPEFLNYNKNPEKVQLSVGIDAELTEPQTATIFQMYGIFDAKYISFEGKDGDFIVSVHSGENENFSNSGKMVIGKTDETFNATIKAELFNLPKSAYKVVVSRKGWVFFGNDTYEIFIPSDANHSTLR